MVFKIRVKNCYVGQVCPMCTLGTIDERSVSDDWDETFTCDQCEVKYDRYRSVTALPQEINDRAGRFKEPIYISGPITGMPDGNKDAFLAMEGTLKVLGYTEIINPRNLDTPQAFKDGEMEVDVLWPIMMKQSVRDMMECNTIIFLDGWEQSRGARIEYELAKEVKMKCIEVDLGYRSEYSGEGVENSIN